MTVDLLYILGIRSVEPVWYARFETRRLRENEQVEQIEQTKFRGVLEDRYVWEIAPMTLMDPNQIRFSRIHDDINDVHIPLLEEDVSWEISSVKGVYKRERTFRFGKQISDAVTIESKIKYRDGRIVKYETK